MAIQHDNGSVTLTHDEFTTCAHHLEMTPTRFLEFLTENPDGFTREQLVEQILGHSVLANFEPESPAN